MARVVKERVCPWCNKKTKVIGSHIKKHNKTILEYLLKKNNLTELPKCPICGKFVSIKRLHIHKTCGDSKCVGKYIVNEGKHIFSSKNRVLDENGIDIMASKSKETAKKNSTNPFLGKNLIKDEKGKSLIHIKSRAIILKNGTCSFQSHNLIRDDEGKSILHIEKARKRVEDGTHHFLSHNLIKDNKGRSISHTKGRLNSSKNGTNPLQYKNRVRDENGNSIIHKKAVESFSKNFRLKNWINPDDFKRDFIMNTFIDKNGKFMIRECGKHFNISYTHMKYYIKNELNITNEDNISNIHSRYEEMISKLLDSHNIEYKVNTRRVIPPYELDIYIPSYNLGIEVNGLYWHRRDNLSFKSNLCKDKNIQLLHIMDNELDNNIKKDIWLSVIKSKLKLNDRIYARKCELKKLNKFPSRFYDNNHLQGNVIIRESINYGLYYDNKLVACMSFCKSRYDKKYEFELLRYASLINYNIIGGFSRLFKKFIKEYNPNSIISYANRRWSYGGVYDTNGFKFIKTTSPNYFYINPTHTNFKSRQSYQKHMLKNILEKYDDNLTERENMLNNGYSYFYDSGNLIYVYNK